MCAVQSENFFKKMRTDFSFIRCAVLFFKILQGGSFFATPLYTFGYAQIFWTRGQKKRAIEVLGRILTAVVFLRCMWMSIF